MTELTIDRLTEYALGTLSKADNDAIEQALPGSADAQRELAAIREMLALVGTELPPVTPTSDARNALLAALSTGARYRPFLADLMRHFDLSAERVRELMDAIDDPNAWEAGPFPGISVMHFAGGPNAVGNDTGFVRLPRGLQFPYHRHLGHEVNYVLEGALRDGDGKLYVAGEAIERSIDSAHEFSVPDDADALIAVVQSGFEFVNKE